MCPPLSTASLFRLFVSPAANGFRSYHPQKELDNMAMQQSPTLMKLISEPSTREFLFWFSFTVNT